MQCVRVIPSVTSVCSRRLVTGWNTSKRNIHSGTSGDLSKFVPNVAQVSPNTASTALTHRRVKPKEYYLELCEEYSTKGVERFKRLKKIAANLAPMKTTENPQFILSNMEFAKLVTDFSKYDLDTVNPYQLVLDSHTHELRVDAQRVTCAVIKKKLAENDIEKAFDYFRLLQNSYLPVDPDIYSLFSNKIKEAFYELLANKTKVPALSTLNTILNYFTETDRLAEAFTLVISMKMAGIAPSHHTYQALLNACMKYEDTDDAMVAFDLMREDDLTLDYAHYDRLFHLCASSIYPLGAKTVLEEMCKRFEVPTGQRWLNMTTLYITEFMKLAGITQSARGRRGFVTAVQIEARLVFPPKTNNNRLLEPNFGEEKEDFLQALLECQYGLVDNGNPKVIPIVPNLLLTDGGDSELSSSQGKVL